MRVLNINLYFFPSSIGGATVVAEKLAWGLVQQGHEVTNVCLSHCAAGQDMTVFDTPFGRTVAINNVFPGPDNRFSSPVATSLLAEVAEIVQPDVIVVHAVQNMGIMDFLRDPKWLARARIVAHDFFWGCLQGFRTLPDGTRCHRDIGALSCRQCAWFPGLIEETYRSARQILNGCHAVVFPSDFLRRGYGEIFGDAPGNAHVLSNPDRAEMILPPGTGLPPAPGLAERQAGKTVYGFVGGPGETKGWTLIRQFIDQANGGADSHVVLFDIGRGTARPWYIGQQGPGVTVADPFHWTYAAQALGAIDVMLMPSRVQESFGLAAREALSLGAQTVIRPSGALAELAGHAHVVMAEEGDTAASLSHKLRNDDTDGKPVWSATSIGDYVDRLLAI